MAIVLPWATARIPSVVVWLRIGVTTDERFRCLIIVVPGVMIHQFFWSVVLDFGEFVGPIAWVRLALFEIRSKTDVAVRIGWVVVLDYKTIADEIHRWLFSRLLLGDLVFVSIDDYFAFLCQFEKFG